MARRSTRISKRLSAPQPTPPSPPRALSPPLPPASLLSLPNELLEHIVRLWLPEKVTRITYHNRQTCLRHLTLVSKRFLVVVQPVLEETTRALAGANPKTWNKAVDKLQRDPEPFRFVFLDGTRKKGSWALLDWALEQSSNLRHLQLGEMAGVNLECLAELHYLSRLELLYVALVDVDCVFSRVEELTCVDVTIASATPSTFLSASTFPSLKKLLFSSHSAYPDGTNKVLVVDPVLLQCLEVLVNPVYGSGSVLAPPPACKVLRDLPWDWRSRPLPSSCDTVSALRIYEPDPLWYTSYSLPRSLEVDALVDTLTDLRRRSDSLHLVILPTRLNTKRSGWSLNLRESVDALLDFLDNEGIQVEYEDAEQLPLSEVFLAHVRE